MSGVTVDRPAPGLVVAQPARGFRYGAEAFWLAGFALETCPGARDALDLGTGSGVIAMLLARRGLDVIGVDVRPEWRELWARTLAGSTVTGSVDLRVCDVGQVEARVDLVVSNPPYFPLGSGPVAPDPFRAAARTESSATVSDFGAVALRCLRPGGVACFVLPTDREPALTAVPGARVARIVRVGRRRSLVALAPGVGAPAAPSAVHEDGPECAGWYEAVAGAAGLPYRDT